VEELRRRALPTGASVAELSIPRQLPPAVPDFTGRADHLAELDALLDRREGMLICTIAGSPGVGKTTLAVHWGHRVARRFPDGQLAHPYRDIPAPSGACS
jgi:hypothetical protein